MQAVGYKNQTVLVKRIGTTLNTHDGVTGDVMKGLNTIRSKSELQKTLAEIERLLVLDPDPVSKKGEALKVLTLLVEDHERGARQRLQPDPIEAILFRMEQQNLTPRDLV